jgi:hypothetical protein
MTYIHTHNPPNHFFFQKNKAKKKNQAIAIRPSIEITPQKRTAPRKDGQAKRENADIHTPKTKREASNVLSQ